GLLGLRPGWLAQSQRSVGQAQESAGGVEIAVEDTPTTRAGRDPVGERALPPLSTPRAVRSGGGGGTARESPGPPPAPWGGRRAEGGPRRSREALGQPLVGQPPVDRPVRNGAQRNGDEQLPALLVGAIAEPPGAVLRDTGDDVPPEGPRGRVPCSALLGVAQA